LEPAVLIGNRLFTEHNQFKDIIRVTKRLEGVDANVSTLTDNKSVSDTLTDTPQEAVSENQSRERPGDKLVTTGTGTIGARPEHGSLQGRVIPGTLERPIGRLPAQGGLGDVSVRDGSETTGLREAELETDVGSDSRMAARAAVDYV